MNITRYNVTSPTSSRTTSISSTPSSETPSCSNQQSPEETAACFFPLQNGDSPAPSVISTGSGSSVRVIPPMYFLNFVQKDLDALVVSRRKWLDGMSSFASLLDDMLKSYDEGNEDVNSMDCY